MLTKSDQKSVSAHLHLRFRHAQGIGELGSLRSRQVLCLLESLLQGKYLLAREGGPRVFLLPVLVKVARQVWKYIWLVITSM